MNRFHRSSLVFPTCALAAALGAAPAPPPESPRRLPPAPAAKSLPVGDRIAREVAELLRRHANDKQSESLWTQVRGEVDNVLLALFRNGELLGKRPEEAYFVRCDRTTMTAQDVAAGLLKVQLGYAALKPAEFQLAQFQQAVRKP